MILATLCQSLNCKILKFTDDTKIFWNYLVLTQEKIYVNYKEIYVTRLHGLRTDR